MGGVWGNSIRVWQSAVSVRQLLHWVLTPEMKKPKPGRPHAKLGQTRADRIRTGRVLRTLYWNCWYPGYTALRGPAHVHGLSVVCRAPRGLGLWPFRRSRFHFLVAVFCTLIQGNSVGQLCGPRAVSGSRHASATNE